MKSTLITITAFLMFIKTACSQPKDRYEIYALDFAGSKSKVPALDIAINGYSKDSVSFIMYFWYLNGNCMQKRSDYPGTRSAGYVQV